MDGLSMFTFTFFGWGPGDVGVSFNLATSPPFPQAFLWLLKHAVAGMRRPPADSAWPLRCASQCCSGYAVPQSAGSLHSDGNGCNRDGWVPHARLQM